MYPNGKNVLWRNWKDVCKSLWAALIKPKRPTQPLSDHLARDIGISPAELDRQRHQWPSQTARHPRL